MGRDTRPLVLEWMDTVRRGTPLKTLYEGVPDRTMDELGRRRETRRLLAEAVRIHVDDPERALGVLEGVPSPLPRDPRTLRFLDLLTGDVLYKAQRRMSTLDVRGAIELLRRVPRASTNFLEAQLLLGQVFLQASRGEEARRCYIAAREVDPKSFDAVAGLARALQIDQNYQESAKVWREAIEMQPGLSSIHVQLALCYMRLERIDDAKASCRKALEINPNDRRAADLLKDLGKP
jgi:tetratricopeptide (TPR) repeat protein